jgi:hypothetical protein
MPDFESVILTEPRKHINFAAGEANLDILTTAPGLDFDRAYAALVVARQDGVEIPVIAKPDLIAVKKEVAARDPQRRERELREVESLERATA